MSLGDVLDGMFRLTRDHWRAFTLALGALWGIVLIVYAVGFVLLGISTALTARDLATGVLPGSQPGAFTALFAGFGVFFLVLFLMLVVILPLSYGVPVHIAATGYRNGQVTARDSLRAGLRHYWRLLGALVLQALIIMGIAVVLAIPLIALSSAAGDSGGIMGVIMLLAIAVAVVVVAAYTRMALIVPAVMAEGLGPMEAVRRSNALVKGKTPTVFGRLLVAMLIAGVIALVLAFGSIFVLSLVAGTAGASDNAGAAVVALVAGIVMFVIQIVASLLQQALVGCALVLVYFDRRVRTEGFDLTEGAEQLGARTNPAW